MGDARAEGEYCGRALLKLGEDRREPGREAVCIENDQLAARIGGESCRITKVLR